MKIINFLISFFPVLLSTYVCLEMKKSFSYTIQAISETSPLNPITFVFFNYGNYLIILPVVFFIWLVVSLVKGITTRVEILNIGLSLLISNFIILVTMASVLIPFSQIIVGFNPR